MKISFSIQNFQLRFDSKPSRTKSFVCGWRKSLKSVFKRFDINCWPRAAERKPQPTNREHSYFIQLINKIIELFEKLKILTKCGRLVKCFNLLELKVIQMQIRCRTVILSRRIEMRVKWPEWENLVYNLHFVDSHFANNSKSTAPYLHPSPSQNHQKAVILVLYVYLFPRGIAQLRWIAIICLF